MHIALLVKNYVDSNINKKITLTDIKKHLHYSTVTITEHFKRGFGITIMEYVTERKISIAKQMLTETDMKVREVGEACGFSNTESFSRTFKKHTGMSPLEWKRSIQAQKK